MPADSTEQSNASEGTDKTVADGMSDGARPNAKSRRGVWLAIVGVVIALGVGVMWKWQDRTAFDERARVEAMLWETTTEKTTQRPYGSMEEQVLAEQALARIRADPKGGLAFVDEHLEEARRGQAVYGRWMWQDASDTRIGLVLRKRGGLWNLSIFRSDGTESNEQLQSIKKERGYQLKRESMPSDDYLLVTPNGQLELHDAAGLITSLQTVR